MIPTLIGAVILQTVGAVASILAEEQYRKAKGKGNKKHKKTLTFLPAFFYFSQLIFKFV